MEKEPSHMTVTMLDLTLEIIYLLTGEDCTVVKKSSAEHMTPNSHPCVSNRYNRTQNPIMDPPPFTPRPERHNDKKILKVIQKMIGLLTGEVSGGFWEIIIQ
ncbi:oocyte zinc finger protein XlCOF29-like [Mantella aurantiaca]